MRTMRLQKQIMKGCAVRTMILQMQTRTVFISVWRAGLPAEMMIICQPPSILRGFWKHIIKPQAAK